MIGANALAIGEFILQIQRPAPIPAFQVPFPPAPLIGRTQELDALYECFLQLNTQQHEASGKLTLDVP